MTQRAGRKHSIPRISTEPSSLAIGLKSAIMAELAGIGAALSTVKTLWDLAKSVKDANVGMKITAELGNIQGQLIDVQQKTISIQQTNQELRDELQRYKSFTFIPSIIPLRGDVFRTPRKTGRSARSAFLRAWRCTFCLSMEWIKIQSIGFSIAQQHTKRQKVSCRHRGHTSTSPKTWCRKTTTQCAPNPSVGQYRTRALGTVVNTAFLAF